MGILFWAKTKPKSKKDNIQEDHPKKNDNPDNNTEKADIIIDNQENNIQNNDDNSNPKQNESENNQDNSISDTNEPFIALEPDKINNSISNSSLVSHKRKRESFYEGKDFSFEKKKKTSNITNEENEEELMQEIEEERKKLDILYEKLEILKKKSKEEIDKKILQENNTNNNLNKNDLQKSIRNILETTVNNQKDIKEIKDIYNSLNEKFKKSLNDSLMKLEEELNKETYLKTEILKKSYDKAKPKTIGLVEIKEEEEKDNEINDNNKADDIEEINNKNCKRITESNKPNIIEKEEGTNNDNQKIVNDFNNYSFKCLNDNLNFELDKGTFEGIYQLTLQNDGLFPWPKNETILSTDRSRSNIKIQDVILKPLNPDLNYSFDIKFRHMNNLPEGKYYSYLIFNAKGKQFGNSILINVEIKEKNNLKN